MRPRGGERGVPGVPGAEREIPGGGETVLPRLSSARLGLLADGWPAGTPSSSGRGAGGRGVSGLGKETGASRVSGEKRMSGVGGGSAGHSVGSGARGAGGGSPRSRPGDPGGCRSRPRPSEASKAVPRSSARWISLGVPEPPLRSAGLRRGSSGSGLGRGGSPGRGHRAQVRLSSGPQGPPRWPWDQD